MSGLEDRSSTFELRRQWLVRLDSNQQHLRYQQSALTIELRTKGTAKWDRTIHAGKGNVIPSVRHPLLGISGMARAAGLEPATSRLTAGRSTN